MKEKRCQIVSYASKCFETEVLTHLENDRIFALTDLPEELKQAIKNLFASGDDLFDHLHEYAESDFPPIIEAKKVRGLFHPKKYALLCNNGARFFIATDKNKQIINERMPIMHGGAVISEAANVFNRFMDDIIIRILQSIANRYKLKFNELKDMIIGESAIGLSRYYPITQNRVRQLYNDEVLAVNGDQIEQFGEHRDVNPMTIITYRNGPQGLLVRDKNSKELIPLSVSCDNKPYLLIFTGTILKELTNGNVRALKHQVVTNPEEQHQEAQRHPHAWRFMLAKFTYCNAEILEPLMTMDGERIQPPRQRKYQRDFPLTQDKFFMDHLSTAKAIREKAKTKEFPEGVAKKYPRDVKYREIYAAQLGEDSLLTL
ncbi:MAG: hypothetical protein M3R00_09875 [Pseudomonadota bacterium]|nr:hypothetical protein [Pseudomonadota bacterium]